MEKEGIDVVSVSRGFANPRLFSFYATCGDGVAALLIFLDPA